MPVTGKMTVDLYANPDPFIQGMKAAENSAKKSGEGIAGHISKINAKQLKGAVHEVLGGLGTISLLESGAQLGSELVKGFSDGTVKDFGSGVQLIQSKFEGFIKSIPLVGSFFELGRSIQDAFTGRSEEIDRTTKALKELEIQNNNVKKTNKEANDAQAALGAIGNIGSSITKSKFADFSDNLKAAQETERQKEYNNRIAGGERTAAIMKANQGKDSKSQWAQEEIAKLIKDNEEAASAGRKDQEKADAIIFSNKQKQFIAQQAADVKTIQNQNNIADIQKTINDLSAEKANIGKTDLDILIERLKKEGVEANDLKYIIKDYKDIAAAKQAAIDKPKNIENFLNAQEALSRANMGVNEAGANLDAARSNRTASATSVDTALGSIKLQGVTDFSKSKEIEKAQQALSAAKTTVTNTKAIADGVAKLVQMNGGTT